MRWHELYITHVPQILCLVKKILHLLSLHLTQVLRVTVAIDWLLIHILLILLLDNLIYILRKRVKRI